MNSKRIAGKLLNERWGINALHALYREDGKWYHHLKHFPGALLDKNGYIVFKTKDDYVNCDYLDHKVELHCTSGISSIPGYIKVIG